MHGSGDLGPLGALGEQRAQPQDERVGLVGLADEAVRADLQGLHDLAGLAQGGDEDDGQVAERRIGLDRPALEAGEARHHHVAHHEVVGLRGQPRERRLAIRGHLHPEAFSLQDQAQQPGLGGAVLDHQNARRAHRDPTGESAARVVQTSPRGST